MHNELWIGVLRYSFILFTDHTCIGTHTNTHKSLSHTHSHTPTYTTCILLHIWICRHEIYYYVYNLFVISDRNMHIVIHTLTHTHAHYLASFDLVDWKLLCLFSHWNQRQKMQVNIDWLYISDHLFSSCVSCSCIVQREDVEQDVPVLLHAVTRSIVRPSGVIDESLSLCVHVHVYLFVYL